MLASLLPPLISGVSKLKYSLIHLWKEKKYVSWHCRNRQTCGTLILKSCVLLHRLLWCRLAWVISQILHVLIFSPVFLAFNKRLMLLVLSMFVRWPQSCLTQGQVHGELFNGELVIKLVKVSCHCLLWHRKGPFFVFLKLFNPLMWRNFFQKVFWWRKKVVAITLI